MRPSVWQQLGLDGPADAGAIRKAYAQALRAMDPDADPAGFAALRAARDGALRLARGQAQPMPAMAVDEAGIHSAPWALAGEVWQVPQPAPMPACTAPIPSPAPLLAAGGSPRPALAPAPQPLRHAWPFGRYQLPGHRVPQPDLRPVQAPETRLYTLLIEGEAGTDAPFTPDEEADARYALREVLALAHTSSLERATTIDQWCAHLLVRSWPRCAPLLEQAANAFGWPAMAGQLGERDEVAFLNARLAGYLFVRDVAASNHPHHAAWAELEKPGPAGLIHRRLFGKARVVALLQLIERKFPEVEHYLSPERVGSWQRALEPGSIAADRRTRGLYIAGMFLVIRLALAMHQFTAGTPQPAPTPFAAPTISASQIAMADAAVQHGFGPGHDMAWLKAHNADMADTLLGNVRYLGERPAGQSKIDAQLISQLRRRSYWNGRESEPTLLVPTMRVRLGLLQAAQAAGTKACDSYMSDGLLEDDVAVPQALREQEQALAARLVEAGELGPPRAHKAHNASVPGALVAKVMAQTGLSHERVAAAMVTTHGNPDRCAVDTALLAATLRWKGAGSTAILRTL